MATGGQKCHVMWILTNQQAAWWCNALQLPSEKTLWNPFISVIHITLNDSYASESMTWLYFKPRNAHFSVHYLDIECFTETFQVTLYTRDNAQAKGECIICPQLLLHCPRSHNAPKLVYLLLIMSPATNHSSYHSSNFLCYDKHPGMAVSLSSCMLRLSSQTLTCKTVEGNLIACNRLTCISG